jgi:uncharacterized protein (DUF1015 family)
MTSKDHIMSAFRGIRYQAGPSGDLSALLAPPYDIISEADQADLYARHEHNFVRIERPMGSDADTHSDNRYSGAASTLRQWLGDGVLTREKAPTLYLLEQEFEFSDQIWRRRGVFGLVRLPERDEHYVLAHEGTLPEPKRDRLRIMRACQAMTSPIMAMHEDPEGLLADIVAQVGGDPESVAHETDGVVDRLWILREESLIADICGAVGRGPIFIADGHHRFDTALAYRDEMRGVARQSGARAGFECALMIVISAQDAGLAILPTHRLLSGLGADGTAQMKARLHDVCEVQQSPLPDAAAFAGEGWAASAPTGRHAFGAYCGDGKFYTLSVRDRSLPRNGFSAPALDVVVLHHSIIDPVLAGLEDREPRPAAESEQRKVRRRIAYVTDARQAIAAVNRGEHDFAFFLRPTRVSDVLAAGRAGQRMPGKSTYFYPKVPSGLVLSDASSEPI